MSVQSYDSSDPAVSGQRSAVSGWRGGQSADIDNFNAINRGVYISDNLPFLRSLNDESIDLVCIDPPFAKKDTFVGDVDLSDDEIATEQRLLSHWGIRDEEDAIRQGVVWPMSGYADIWSWENDIHEDWVTQLERDYEGISKLIDATRYVHDDGTAAYLCYMAVRLIEIRRVLKPAGSVYLHCDQTANSYIRQLMDGVFGKDNLQNEIVWSYGLGGSSPKRWSKKHDTIFFYTKSDKWHFDKPKVAARSNRMKGQEKGMTDVWDIPSLNNMANERTKYPTQKPVKLAELIISASSKPGDVVLDCFAGCAYVGVAAERQGRRWVACDINPRAWTAFKMQFNKSELVLLRCHDETTGQQVMSSEAVVTVHGPNELPARTSPVSETQPPDFKPPERKFKVPASIIPEREMLERLLQISDYKAWCCGFANRRPNGDIVHTVRNFHLDHIDPKSKQGSNDILNRAPMCPAHNTRKGNRRVHLDDYRREIAEDGELMVDTMGDLVQLPDVRREVEGIYARAYAQRYPLAQA